MDLRDKIIEMRKSGEVTKKLDASGPKRWFVILFSFLAVLTLLMMISVPVMFFWYNPTTDTVAEITKVEDSLYHRSLVISTAALHGDTLQDTLQVFADDTLFTEIRAGDSVPLYYKSNETSVNSIDPEYRKFKRDFPVHIIMVMMTLVWGGPFIVRFIYGLIVRRQRVRLWEKGVLYSATIAEVKSKENKYAVTVEFDVEGEQKSIAVESSSKEFARNAEVGQVVTILSDPEVLKHSIILDPLFSSREKSIECIHEEHRDRGTTPSEVVKSCVPLGATVVTVLFLLFWILFPLSSIMVKTFLGENYSIDSTSAVVSEVLGSYDTSLTIEYTFKANELVYKDSLFLLYESYSDYRFKEDPNPGYAVGDTVTVVYNEKSPQYNHISSGGSDQSSFEPFILLFFQAVFVFAIFAWAIFPKYLRKYLLKKGLIVKAVVVSAKEKKKIYSLRLSYEVDGKKINATGTTKEMWYVEQWQKAGEVTILVHPRFKKLLLFPELYL